MKWLLGCLILLLSGCAFLQDQTLDKIEGVSDIITATTDKDTVESADEEEAGLVDSLRSRIDAKAGDPNWSPIMPASAPDHYVASTGSLFNPANEQNFYQDIKPYRIGDILTVLLEESTQAQKNASSDTFKSSNLSLDPIVVGGNEIQIQGNSLSYEISNDNQSSGSTSANQSNSISGSISVEVIKVLANGNLVIRGEKWLKINTGDEFIRLSGSVRPQDIAKNNTIGSTRIANAKIQYSATGSKQDIQEQSWLARFFNVIF